MKLLDLALLLRRGEHEACAFEGPVRLIYLTLLSRQSFHAGIKLWAVRKKMKSALLYRSGQRDVVLLLDLARMLVLGRHVILHVDCLLRVPAKLMECTIL